MTVVLAPLPGRVVALADVPDPVFAQQMVGSGVAIEPARGQGPLTVVAPISGKILKLHPHAFVIFGEKATGVLVHIGIDTVKLEGDGFTLIAAEGDTVDAGDPIVSFDPAHLDTLLQSLWVDSLVFDPEPLRLLAHRFGSARIVIGTDYPFIAGQLEGARDFLHEARDVGALAASDVSRIFSHNAYSLFGIADPPPFEHPEAPTSRAVGVSK